MVAELILGLDFALIRIGARLLHWCDGGFNSRLLIFFFLLSSGGGFGLSLFDFGLEHLILLVREQSQVNSVATSFIQINNQKTSKKTNKVNVYFNPRSVPLISSITFKSEASSKFCMLTANK